jgi:outer membrane lipoprotein-sorting protein
MVAAATLLMPLDGRGAELSSADRQTIAAVEDYLNAIETMHSRFVQMAPDGGYASGSIYLQRPEKMRVEYDPPVPILIVSTGIWLIYSDSELGQVTHLPVSSSPVSLLVRENMSFGDEIEVTRVARADGTLRLTIKDNRGFSADLGEITLIFAEDPLRLEKWTVLDAQGLVTTVTLIDPRFGIALDPVLFKFVDTSPDREFGR